MATGLCHLVGRKSRRENNPGIVLGEKNSAMKGSMHALRIREAGTRRKKDLASGCQKNSTERKKKEMSEEPP